MYTLNGQTSIIEIHRELQAEILHFEIGRSDNPAQMQAQLAHNAYVEVTPPAPPLPPKQQPPEMQSTLHQSQVISSPPRQTFSTSPSRCSAGARSFVTEEALGQGGYFHVHRAYDGQGEGELGDYLAVVEGDSVNVQQGTLQIVTAPPYRYPSYVYGRRTSSNSLGWLPVAVLGM